MAVTKTVSSRSPYIGRTFQKQTNLLAGRSGYVSGGETSDNGATITVQPVTFLQSGLLVEEDAATAGIAVPTLAEPWFVLASSADDDPDSGITLTATADLSQAVTGTVVSYKSNGVWRNPVAISLSGIESQQASEVGKESGFRARATLSGGNVSTLEVSRGTAVDPSGIRREITGSGSSDILSATPVLPHESRNRMDHLVLRQREDVTGELVYLMGATVPDIATDVNGTVTTLAATGANSRPHYFARRGGDLNDQWWAWGEGTNLRMQGGPGGGAFAATTILTSGTIDNTFIAGQRAADDAVLVLYTDGNDLRLISINQATGAIVDAAVTIDTEGNAITHVRAALDANEDLHVVYEHDEATQQVYYTKVRTDTTLFAQHSVTPRIVDGSASGNNDTGPCIGVDRQGTVHVAYITGSGSNTFGEIRYSTISQNGVTLTQQTYSNTGDVGSDLDRFDDAPVEIYSNGGTTISNVRHLDLVVTPHDEVYGVVAGLDSADSLPEHLMLFNPAFEDRLGFAIIDLPLDQLAALTEIKQAAITSDEKGGLYLGYVNDRGASDYLSLMRIDSQFALDGRVEPSILAQDSGDNESVAAWIGDLFLIHGHSGEMVFTYEDAGVSAKSVAFDGNASVADIAYSNRTASSHPKDVYLASWFVPGEATPVLPEKDLQIFHTRPKRMNYPFLVGNNGDFHGYNAIEDAMFEANLCGGKIVIRNGEHFLNSQLKLQGGIDLIGEGMPTLRWKGSLGGPCILVEGKSALSVSGVSGQTLTLASAEVARGICPGDLANMATSGFHRVVRVINNKVVLDGVAPVGATVDIYATGTRIENLLLKGHATVAADRHITLSLANKASVSNIAFQADSAAAARTCMEMNACIDSVVENCDFSTWTPGASGTGLSLLGGDKNLVFGSIFEGVTAECLVDDTEENLRIYGCTVGGGGVTEDVYNLTGTRTTEVDFSGNRGSVLGASKHWANTFVGERIRTIGGAMSFYDLNIDNGPAQAIPLSDSSNDGFSGGNSNFPLSSLLHGHNNSVETLDQGLGNGVLSGLAPSEGTFPQVNIAAGQAIYDGQQFAYGSGSHAGGSEAFDTDYFYYLAPDGTITRTTTFDPFNSSDGTLVAYARSSGDASFWTEFQDMRRFVDAASFKGPLVVSESQDEGATVRGGHFQNIRAALEWIARMKTLDTQGTYEIIITQEIVETAGPIEIDLDRVGQLIIRGVGQEAGIRWTSDSSLFHVTGRAADATNPIEWATLRISELVMNAGRGSAYSAGTAAIDLENGTGDRMQRLTVDRCRILETGGFPVSTGIRVRPGLTILDDLVVSECDISGFDDFGVDVSGGGGRAYILDSRIHGESSAGSVGVRLDSGSNRWIVDSVISGIDTGVDAGIAGRIRIVGTSITAGGGTPSAGIDVTGTGYTSFVVAGCDIASFPMGVDASATTTGRGFKVLDTLFTTCDEAIEFTPSSDGDAVISGNTFNNCGGSSGTGEIVNVAGDCVVADNAFFDGDPADAILVGSNCVVSGNGIEGDCRIGIRVAGGSDRTIIANNSLSLLDGTGSRDAIVVNGTVSNDERVSIIGNNIVSPEFGISLNTNTTRCLVSGNNVEITNERNAAGHRAFRSSGSDHCVTGNYFTWIGDNNNSDTDAVCSFFNTTAGNNVFTGNFVVADNDLGSDYSTGEDGMSALIIQTPNTAIVGNYFENRGEDTAKATIKFPSATATDHQRCVLLGNVINNRASTFDHIYINTGTVLMGSGGTAEPGDNERA